MELVRKGILVGGFCDTCRDRCRHERKHRRNCFVILLLVASFMLAKAKSFAPLLIIVANLMYAYICFSQKLFGEVIFCFAITQPLAIYALVHWARHKHKGGPANIVTIARLSKKEMTLLFISQIFLTPAYYFGLRALGANLLILSTLSVVIGVLGSYCQARRSKFAMLFWVFSDIVSVMLWCSVYFFVSKESAVMIITPVMYLIIDAYGFFTWRKIEKKQQGRPLNHEKSVSHNTSTENTLCLNRE